MDLDLSPVFFQLVEVKRACVTCKEKDAVRIGMKTVVDMESASAAERAKGHAAESAKWHHEGSACVCTTVALLFLLSFGRAQLDFHYSSLKRLLPEDQEICLVPTAPA